MGVDEELSPLAAWLFQEISAAEISYRALARRLGVHPSTIGHWISGRSIPDPPNARKLAEVFHVDPDFVLGLAGHRPDQDVDLAEMDPEMRVYFLGYSDLEPHLQEMLKQQMRAVYETNRRERERTERERQTRNRPSAPSR